MKVNIKNWSAHRNRPHLFFTSGWATALPDRKICLNVLIHQDLIFLTIMRLFFTIQRYKKVVEIYPINLIKGKIKLDKILVFLFHVKCLFSLKISVYRYIWKTQMALRSLNTLISATFILEWLFALINGDSLV